MLRYPFLSGQSARLAAAGVAVAVALLGAPAAHAGVLFDSSSVFPVSSAMGALVATGDFNGDGTADFVSVPRYDVNGSMTVLLGRGDGSFQKLAGVAAGGLSLATGDLNSDGKLDLAVPGFSSVATVLFGKGDGTFAAPVAVGTNSGGAPGGIMSITIAQLGGSDPGLDIAVTNTNGLQLLLGKGDGTFAAPATYPGWGAAELAASDFTGDGHTDLAVTRFIGSVTFAIAVLPGSPSGVLGTPIMTLPPAALGSPLVADDDGDGLPDLLAINQGMNTSAVSLYYGAGGGTFEMPVRAELGAYPARLDAGDFDADGATDYVAATYDETLLLWLHSDTFVEADYSALTADSPTSVAVADINGDHAEDVVTATYSGKLIVSRNAPGAQAAPAGLAFAPASVGATSAAQTFTISNPGTPDLRISGVTVEGPAAGDFSTSGGCQGTAVKSGAACSVAVSFTPRAAGARAATLVLTGNQGGGSTRLALTGTGTPVAASTRPTPLTVSLKVGRARLGGVLSGALALSLTCSRACNVRTTATIDGQIAHRLGLSKTRKAVVVGRATAALPAGKAKSVRLRLSRKAARALRHQRTLTLAVTATATDTAGTAASVRRSVRLRR